MIDLGAFESNRARLLSDLCDALDKYLATSGELHKQTGLDESLLIAEKERGILNQITNIKLAMQTIRNIELTVKKSALEKFHSQKSSDDEMTVTISLYSIDRVLRSLSGLEALAFIRAIYSPCSLEEARAIFAAFEANKAKANI